MYPWAYTNEHSKDFKVLYRVAKSIALKIFQKTSKKYTFSSASLIEYNISGLIIEYTFYNKIYIYKIAQDHQ